MQLSSSWRDDISARITPLLVSKSIFHAHMQPQVISITIWANWTVVLCQTVVTMYMATLNVISIALSMECLEWTQITHQGF